MYSQEDVLRPNGRTSSAVGSKSADGGATSSSTKKSNGLTFALGVEGGIGLNFFSQTMQAGTPQDQIDVFSKGSGLGGFGALVADIGLSDMFGIQPRIGYQATNFSRDGSYQVDCPDRSGFGLDTVATISYDDDTKNLSFYTVGLSLRFSPIKKLMILAGPTFHFRNQGSTPTIDATGTITSPDRCWFYSVENGITDSSKTSTASSELTGINNFRVGLDLGIAYKFDLNSHWALVPRIGYQLMFTKIAEDEKVQDAFGNVTDVLTNRKLSTLQFGLGLWYYFN